MKIDEALKAVQDRIVVHKVKILKTVDLKQDPAPHDHCGAEYQSDSNFCQGVVLTTGPDCKKVSEGDTVIFRHHYWDKNMFKYKNKDYCSISSYEVQLVDTAD